MTVSEKVYYLLDVGKFKGFRVWGKYPAAGTGAKVTMGGGQPASHQSGSDEDSPA